MSFRDISTIIKIDRRTGRIVWKLGAPPLSGQHAPTPLPDGNILIFDNGAHRLDESFPFSRVIEVNPPTNGIVWKYQEEISSNFFSPRISNAQRFFRGHNGGRRRLGVCEPLFRSSDRSCEGTEQPRFSRVPLYRG